MKYYYISVYLKPQSIHNFQGHYVNTQDGEHGESVINTKNITDAWKVKELKRAVTIRRTLEKKFGQDFAFIINCFIQTDTIKLKPWINEVQSMFPEYASASKAEKLVLELEYLIEQENNTPNEAAIAFAEHVLFVAKQLTDRERESLWKSVKKLNPNIK